MTPQAHTVLTHIRKAGSITQREALPGLQHRAWVVQRQ